MALAALRQLVGRTQTYVAGPLSRDMEEGGALLGELMTADIPPEGSAEHMVSQHSHESHEA